MFECNYEKCFGKQNSWNFVKKGEKDRDYLYKLPVYIFDFWEYNDYAK